MLFFWRRMWNVSVNEYPFKVKFLKQHQWADTYIQYPDISRIYSVSGHFPLDNCSHRTIAPHEIRPEQLPSRLLPPGQSPLNSFTLDNCPHEISPRAIAPWTFAPRTFSLNNSPLNTRTALNCPPWSSSRNRWQRTSALDNYPSPE